MFEFFSLPRELRDQVYGLCLLQQKSLGPWGRNTIDFFGMRRRESEIGLLRVRKTVRSETSLVFYGQNQFDFSAGPSRDVASFIKEIGDHSNYIRRIRFEAPAFDSMAPGNFVLTDYWVEILAIIRSGCASLSTVTTCPHSSLVWSSSFADWTTRRW